MFRRLCTNGATPNKSGRYPADVRWTGQLQRLLGDTYYVIEEGLGGRLTNVDHFEGANPGRNGFVYYKPSLESHLPLDYIVIMLGTNDVKNVYNRTAQDIADALEEYVTYTKEKVASKDNVKQPKIILVSPIHLDERCYQDVFDASSVAKSLELAPLVQEVAQLNDCTFLDAANHAEVGEDGIHLTKESNEGLAKALAEIIS